MKYDKVELSLMPIEWYGLKNDNGLLNVPRLRQMAGSGSC